MTARRWTATRVPSQRRMTLASSSCGKARPPPPGPCLRRPPAPALALAYPPDDGGTTDLVAYLAGVLDLAALAIAARWLIAHRLHIPVTHESWLPAMGLAVITGVAGLPLGPLPVVRADGDGKVRVHLAAPVSLAALIALLFLESAWLGTPLAQSWAVAALIMATSVIVPVEPLDGAQFGDKGALAAAGITGGVLLVALGII